jgi:magnesium chelatase family protein
LKQDELTNANTAEGSDSIRARVEQAREIQLQRQGKANFMLGTAEIEQYCQPDNAGLALLKTAISKLNLSARAYHRILKVARTIADLSHAANIQPAHIAEAIQYRRHGI